jgi:acetyl esterase/lipase
MKLYFLAALLIAAASLGTAARAAESTKINVWPGKAPSEAGTIGEEADTTKPTDGLVAGRRIIKRGNVSTPTLEIFRPAKDKDTGTAVVIAPGGGYSILAYDLEGTEVAEWLNTLGVTGIVLKYRVPTRPGQPADQPHIQPLQDAQRAMSLVRSKASEWGINPQRIGLLGFSAGGHLAAETATNFDHRSYDAIDDVDKVSCRPDFLVLVYPAYLVNKAGDGLAPEIRVTKETPPTFLAHAENDPVTVESSLRFFLAMKKAGVPGELHVYPTGGHGYGLRRTAEPVTTWPLRCEEWLRTRGLLKK